MKTIAFIPITEKSLQFFYESEKIMKEKPTIIRIYELIKKSSAINDVYICYEGSKLGNFLNKYKVKKIKTSSNHKTGSDRIGEAYIKLNKKYELVLNFFGHDDNLSPYQINNLVKYHSKNKNTDIVIPLYKNLFPENNNLVKVVINKKKEVMYLSRNKIPFETLNKNNNFYVHSNVISFTKNGLDKFSDLKRSKYELVENIELLRALENSMKIKTIFLSKDSYSSVKKRLKSFK